MVDKIAEIQKKKDMCLHLTLAAQEMDRKYHRYTDPEVMTNMAAALADQILNPAAAPEIDADVFSVSGALLIAEANGRDAAVLKNVRSGYKTQGPIDSYLSDPKKCGLRSIMFRDSDLAYYDYRAPEKYTSMTALGFDNVTLNGHISHDLPSDVLTRLSFSRCRMDRSMVHDENETERTTIGSNAVATAAKNPHLKYFFMNEMSLISGFPDKEGPLEWDSLPDTIEYLSLAKTDIMRANFDGLMAYVHSSRNLKAFDCASCGLTDEHAAKLKKALEGTQITVVNLSGNHFSDKMRGELDGMGVQGMMLSGDYVPLDPEDTIRRIVAERPVQGYLKQLSSKEEMKKQGLFFPAARAGTFADILDAVKANGEEMTAEDYALKDTKGRILIAELSKTKQLATVFEPKYWTNTKQMQMSWDIVPEKDREQLDGKSGRPSFQKWKNQVMAGAVRTALSQKMKKGR